MVGSARYRSSPKAFTCSTSRSGDECYCPRQPQRHDHRKLSPDKSDNARMTLGDQYVSMKHIRILRVTDIKTASLTYFVYTNPTLV